MKIFISSHFPGNCLFVSVQDVLKSDAYNFHWTKKTDPEIWSGAQIVRREPIVPCKKINEKLYRIGSRAISFCRFCLRISAKKERLIKNKYHEVYYIYNCKNSLQSSWKSSSGSSGQEGEGPRNMKSIRPPLAVIFFMTYFYRRGMWEGYGPLAPPRVDPILQRKIMLQVGAAPVLRPCVRYAMHIRGLTFPGVWRKKDFSFQRQDMNHSGESKWKYFDLKCWRVNTFK